MIQRRHNSRRPATAGPSPGAAAARRSGVLLHVTSLPDDDRGETRPGGREGGDALAADALPGGLGTASLRFLEQLREARQTLWQMLPVTPAGAYRSPYDGPSAFAGDPELLSVRWLHDDGLLSEEEVTGASGLRGVSHRRHLTRIAAERNRATGALETATKARERSAWMEDWSLYAALRDRLGRPWTEWPIGLRDRDRSELDRARRQLAPEIAMQRSLQDLFARQWQRLRSRAAELGVELWGDLPFYVAHDSADVWAHRKLFDLNPDGRPATVGGVPPDAFTDLGQLWGNPTYRWPHHRRDGYRWWRRRIWRQLELFDRVRLDHFRGFVAAWKVPADAASAKAGRWVRGPGRALFEALEEAGSSRAGQVSPAETLFAEDLGQITPAVNRLRKRLGLLGTRVLQFGFDDPGSEHHFDRLDADCVVYTGTHDNDTSRGWFAALDPEARDRVAAELDLGPQPSGRRVARELLSRAWHSGAAVAIAPLQDLLELGSVARMNFPGTIEGNWRFRAPESLLEPCLERLRTVTERSGRGRRPAEAEGEG